MRNEIGADSQTFSPENSKLFESLGSEKFTSKFCHLFTLVKFALLISKLDINISPEFEVTAN